MTETTFFGEAITKAIASKQIAPLPAAPTPNEIAKARNWVLKKCSEAGTIGPYAERFPIEITPALAQALLSFNDSNRSVSENSVWAYEADIKNDDFKLNGETIIVSIDGMLNDGQTRCKAVLKTGKPILSFMVFGVSRNSRTTVDTGKAKTVGNFIQMEGHMNGTASAVLAKFVWQYAKYGLITPETAKKPTKQVNLKSYFDNKAEIDAAIQLTPSTAYKISHFTLVAFAMLILRRHNEAMALKFIMSLCDGANLETNSPIYSAREKLMQPNKKTDRLTSNERLEIIFTHWNLWRQNRKSKKAITPTGKLPTIEK